jgi:hypothetical protein
MLPQNWAIRSSVTTFPELDASGGVGQGEVGNHAIPEAARFRYFLSLDELWNAVRRAIRSFLNSANDFILTASLLLAGSGLTQEFGIT